VLNDILSIDIQILNIFNVLIVHFRIYFFELIYLIKKKELFLYSFKCANSLTVHRRRLHLLPLLDKINDDDNDKLQTSNSKDKEKVKRTILNNQNKKSIFSLNINMLVIYVNDVFHAVKNLLHIYLKYINLEKQ